jgi:putative hydrolase of HD superfamily
MRDKRHNQPLDVEAEGLLALSRLATRLKSTPRTGWIDRGVDLLAAESVADHSLGMALLAWASAIERQANGADLDPLRVLTLALLHDLAEAETGDWPPYDPTDVPEAADAAERWDFLNQRHQRNESRRAAKRAAEDATMKRLLDALPEAMRTELGSIWEELRAGTTPEARFVKQVDRLETFLQSRHYLRDNPALPVASFRQEVLAEIDDPLLAAIRDAALADEMADETSENASQN